MIVRQDFKDLIPPLSSEEYSQLEENCLREGIRDPLVVWGDILVDGHNRYEIAQKHNLKYQTVSMDFPDDTAAKMWIIQNQLGRRNVNGYVRSVLALRIKQEIAEKAKTKEHERKTTSQISVKSYDTQKQLASLAGVSHDTIHKVEVIEEKAPESIKQACRDGDLSINQAYIKVHPKPKDLVKQAREDHERFQIMKNDKVVDFKEMQKDKTNKKIVMTAMRIELFKIFDMVKKFLLVYGDNLDEIEETLDSGEVLEIIKSCKECQRDMQTVVRKAMGNGGEI